MGVRHDELWAIASSLGQLRTPHAVSQYLIPLGRRRWDWHREKLRGDRSCGAGYGDYRRSQLASWRQRDLSQRLVGGAIDEIHNPVLMSIAAIGE